MSPEEAIEKDCATFRAQSPKKYAIQFKIEGNFIRKGNVDLKDGWIQWDMRAYTPEEWSKKADMLALGPRGGDPRKPTPQRY